MKFQSVIAITFIAIITGCSSASEGNPPPTVVVAKPNVNPDPITPVTPLPIEPIEPNIPVGSFFNIIEGQDLIVSVVSGAIEDIKLTFPSEFDASDITADISYIDNTIKINMLLDYADAPIQIQNRTMTVTGKREGVDIAIIIPFTVTPTTAPDIYLLAGQSNMIGFAGDVKQDFMGGHDASDERILQLNVTSNDQQYFQTIFDFTTIKNNVAEPAIVVAQDPLHRKNKSGQSIGLGLTFAKTALAETTANIVLVPAAYSASAFCEETGPEGQWNALPNDSQFLGNTLMFDRAVLRANAAILETGGILRGILWHQGESDAGKIQCAELYEENLKLLIDQFRLQIIPDVTGDHLDVPFVAGTMSRGGSFSDFDENKTIIDNVHKNLSTITNLADVVNNDDLIPSNGFSCSTDGNCIHFGVDALREMGRRYFDVLNRLVR